MSRIKYSELVLFVSGVPPPSAGFQSTYQYICSMSTRGRHVYQYPKPKEFIFLGNLVTGNCRQKYGDLRQMAIPHETPYLYRLLILSAEVIDKE